MDTLEADLIALAHRLSDAPNPLTIELAANAGNTEFGKVLADWAGRFAEAAGIDLQKGEDGLEARSFRLSNQSASGVSYAAIPEGPEAAPFAEAVACLSGLEPSPEASWRERLDALEEPVEMLIFVTPSCPHCPNQVREGIALALANKKVHLTVVDAEAHTELAVARGARSVPFTEIDNDLGLVGAVSAEVLVEHILNRGSAAHDRAVLNALVENGRTAEAVTGLEESACRQALAELWRHSVLSSRMGLMMLAEEVLEEHPGRLDDIVGVLLPLLESEDGGLRGDTVDLLGAIAHPTAANALERLKDDPDEDVAEAVEDALEAIAERAG